MDFGTQIKKIRTNDKLTQEQLAQKLNVSRQTISSWENNRNLPDLQMVVQIAQTFNLSLDQLILGDNTMTNKLMKDGSEIRKARINLINIVLLTIGAMCFLGSALSGSEMDSNGIIHQPFFFLIPIGYLFLLSGIIGLLIALLKKILKK
ncbi:transcriptional regulator [Bacillus cereus]|nr:transcriptional regulator [Bacillus cereus]PGT63788.1 transcriptional regulator [Bacillus cereus]PGW00713.1 transcriptional regulator [Bacillus cereus]